MVGAMACFIVNDSLVKYASQTMPATQLIFARGIMASALVLGVAWATGATRRIREVVQGWVAFRAVVDAMATMLFLAAMFTFAIARFLIQPIFGAAAVRGPAYHWGGMTLAVIAVIVVTLIARLAAGRSQSHGTA